MMPATESGKRPRTLGAIWLLAGVLCAGRVHSEAFRDQFTDPVDGKFDTSQWLLDKPHGFLPVPIIVTEPAVGNGLGIAPIFFHAPEPPGGDKEGIADARPSKLPSVSAAAALKTENGTWAAGAGHLGIWKQDTIRYLGAVGAASANLKFYGRGNGVSAKGLAFNIDGWFTLQELRVRIADSPWMIGPRYLYLNSQVRFDLGLDIPGIDLPELKSVSSGAGLVLSYDTTDNMFTPTKGFQAKFEGTVNDDSIGSDFDYNAYHGLAYLYWPVSPAWNLAFRADAQLSDGDVPFYALPYLQLRGIPAMRYQGRRTALVEAEARWQLRARWSLLGFTGAGRAASSASALADSPTRSTFGAGFRYLLARRLGLHAGMDIARGPEEWAYYLQVGRAWRN